MYPGVVLNPLAVENGEEASSPIGASSAHRPPVEIAQSRTRLRYREVLSGNIAIGGLSNMVYLITGAVIDLSVIGLT